MAPPHFQNSANCERELCFASDNRKPIVPVRLDSGPFTWSHVITAGALYTDFSDASADWDEKIEELAANIESAAKMQPARFSTAATYTATIHTTGLVQGAARDVSKRVENPPKSGQYYENDE